MATDIIQQSKYFLLRIFRSKDFMFSLFILPLILATIYYSVSTNLIKGEIEPIDVAVETSQGPIPYDDILKKIDIIKVQELDHSQAQKALKAKQVVAIVDPQGQVEIKENGMGASIVKSIMDEIHQTVALGKPMDQQAYGRNYVKTSNTPANGVVLMFFGLVAMTSLYSMFNGLELTTVIQPNFTSLGARLQTTSMNRNQFILLNFVMGTLINLVANLILISYIQLGLKITIIQDLKLSLLILVLANIFGTAYGIVIALLPLKTYEARQQILIISSLFGTFLASGMTPRIRELMDEISPWISRLNPINVISENFYRINLMADTTWLNWGIGYISGLTLVLLVIAGYMLRGQQYDSL
ncbi:ABC transporter permease [Vaginisenegalia massiliensis]|uniref:ABC transporter permease n=1 Tax=Vaginisenegalia massiliensis TaxID=2058294 RepID=UPI000F54423E|nr:ABC transporter permease [Vaginisenegalia massiliensis]